MGWSRLNVADVPDGPSPPWFGLILGLLIVIGTGVMAFTNWPTYEAPPKSRCEDLPGRRLISEMQFKDGSVECRYDAVKLGVKLK